jgi:D-serine deaminase-like pyridoxal phosphate-dependent protein
VFIDIDCGMHRSGILPAAGAFELYRAIATAPGLLAGGLHVYDGHISNADLTGREQECNSALSPVRALRQQLIAAGFPVPCLVAGGTPTFPIYARQTDVECSPGTCVFWDGMCAKQCPGMDFLQAALVLTRVVSKPGKNLLCLDLGHKAIAAENPHPRVHFLNLPDARAVRHSEEHLVVETERAAEFPLGAPLYGIPWHICPTVALYSEAVVVTGGRAAEKWKIEARQRAIHI